MYTIAYHPLILKEDFKKIPRLDQKKIVQAIQKKLSLDPITFGKQLASDLKGYYRLRVGEYRIIYNIQKKEVTVYVIKVGLRKDFIVYLETAKCLKLL